MSLWAECDIYEFYTNENYAYRRKKCSRHTKVHVYIVCLYTHINLYIYILYVHKFIHTSMERLENLLNDNAHCPLLDYGLCRVPSTATTIWRL